MRHFRIFELYRVGHGGKVLYFEITGRPRQEDGTLKAFLSYRMN